MLLPSPKKIKTDAQQAVWFYGVEKNLRIHATEAKP